MCMVTTGFMMILFFVIFEVWQPLIVYYMHKLHNVSCALYRKKVTQVQNNMGVSK